MKIAFSLILMIISANLFAQADPCLKKPHDYDCNLKIRQLLWDDKHEEVSKYIEELIDHHGEELLNNRDVFSISNHIYDHERNGADLFKKFIIPRYGKLNKPHGLNKYYMDFDDFFLREYSALTRHDEVLPLTNIILESPSTYDTLWENPRFPKRLIRKIDKVTEEMEKNKNDVYSKRFNADKKEMDKLKVNIAPFKELSENLCNIKSIDELNEKIKKFGDFRMHENNNKEDLLLCAIKDRNQGMIDYLIENNIYHPEKANEYLDVLSGVDAQHSSPIIEKLMSTANIQEYLDEKYKNITQKHETLETIIGDCTQLSLDEIMGLGSNYSKEMNQLYFEQVKSILIEKGPSLKHRSELLKSIIHGYNMGIDINYIEPSTGKTISHYMAEYLRANSFENVERSLSNKNEADYSIKDKNGDTLAHIAAKTGNLGVLSKLYDGWRVSSIEKNNGTKSFVTSHSSGWEYFTEKNKDGKTPIKLLRKYKKKNKDERKLSRKIIEKFKDLKARRKAIKRGII